MAIKASEIVFHDAAGGTLVSGRLSNLFPAGLIGDATDYRWVVIHNVNPTLTLSATKAWLTVDTRGGTVAVAYDTVGGVVAYDTEFPSAADIATLTYSAPTTMGTGITLGSLPPGTKLRLGIRRILVGATAAAPENNRLNVGGTCPL